MKRIFAVSAVALLASAQANAAVEAPALVSKAPSGIINARQPLTDQQRCANVRQVCHERYRDRGYRQCVTRERCLP
jgi:hypothetical protein